MHHGDMGIIHDLLANPQSRTHINAMSKEGGTPLMLACELDSPELVDKMLKLGADPKASRRDGVTAAEISILRNCVSIATKLLAHLTAPHTFETVAKEGSVEMIDLVASVPAFYTHKNIYDDNALHIALRNGNLRGALIITRKCTSVGFLTALNRGKESPFSIAAALGAWEIMAELRKKKAVTPQDIKKALGALLRAEYDPELSPILAECQLNAKALQDAALVAAQFGNHQALTLEFMSLGVDLRKLQGPKGWRIQHYLAKSDGVLLFREMMAKEHDVLMPLRNDGGKTIPYIAAENRSARVLKFTLERMKKVDASLENHFNGKHLFYAVVESGSLQCVQLLLSIFHEKRKVIVEGAIDKTGLRPIHLAAQIGSLRLVKALVRENASIAVEDNNGDNALCHAVHADAKKIVDYLIDEQGEASINAESLYLAASQADATSLQKLLRVNRSQRKTKSGVVFSGSSARL